MKSENKRVKFRRNGIVPYGFCFGSMGAIDLKNMRTKTNGYWKKMDPKDKGIYEKQLQEHRQYMPHTFSRSAKYLKLISILGGAPRSFFYDSACVSNLGPNNSGMIERRKDGKMHLTSRGRYYIKTRKVEVDVTEFLMNDSYLRYIKDPIDQLVCKLTIGGKEYEVLAEKFKEAKKEQRRRSHINTLVHYIKNLRRVYRDHNGVLKRYLKDKYHTTRKQEVAIMIKKSKKEDVLAAAAIIKSTWMPL